MATKEQLGQLQTFWQEVIDQLRENMKNMKDVNGHNRYATGNTARDINIKNIIDDLDQVLIELKFPEQAIYIEEGVQGWNNKADTSGIFSFKRETKRIPTKVIREWMRSREIVPRNDKKQRIKLTDPEKQLNAIAFRIASAIKRDGINRVPFISEVFTPELINKYKALLVSIYGAQILQEIVIGFESEFATLEKKF